MPFGLEKRLSLLGRASDLMLAGSVRAYGPKRPIMRRKARAKSRLRPAPRPGS